VVQRISDINARLERALGKAGRGRGEVTVVAVTKTVEVEDILRAGELGIKDFGENRVQEMARKHDAVKAGIPAMNWHMIGHLQTNKVRQAVAMSCLIHSVDSVKLAAEIDREAARIRKIMDVLIEVNIAAEASKHGITAEQAVGFASEVAVYSNIRVRGLMCVAPYVDDAEENRGYFRKMRKVLVDIKAAAVDNKYMDTLSMGMTNDYEVAAEEGATMVRIGTGIFGGR
jgi:hypothetical protein